ncbi:FAD-dependent monooxygenase [Streptomyces sp. NPDC001634]|uniref:FAD-dependent monooxygenase n=1 Tax=Streptomyces sp. NPDC001634 TaxID=3154390 RepID=UPI00332F902C
MHSPAGGQGPDTSIQDAYNLGWNRARCCRAKLRRHSSTHTRRSAARSRRTCSACPRASTAGRPAAVRRPGSSGSATGTRRARRRRGRTPARFARATVPRTARWTGYASSTRTGPAPDAAGGRHGRGVAAVRPAHGPDPAYEAYGTGIFLIRPDGCVGWAGETAEGLAGYAGRVGACVAP